MKPFGELKSDALAALRGKWGIAVGAGLLASLVGGAGGGFGLNITVENPEPASQQQLEELKQFFIDHFAWILLVLTLSFLTALAFSILVGSVVRVGYARFNLNLTAGGFLSVSTLFEGFRSWSSIIRVTALQTLIIFLKSCLLFVPGIMAAYDYAMVPYLLAEEPYLGAREALDRSKRMMRGHRMELFMLEMSFFGWALLSALTLGIGFIWLGPYMEATRANYYYALSADHNDAFFYQTV